LKKNLARRGEKFTNTEFMAAAKLYNMPIVVFNGKKTNVFKAFT
jgi:hypothetical protein